MSTSAASWASNPPSSDRRYVALLSALAEAPDLSAAGTFLLTDILAATGAERAALLRFDAADDQLVLAASAGFDDAVSAAAIAERTHPLMVSTLALSPVIGDRAGRAHARIPFEAWTALPMPRLHYRGAPAIWPESYAADVLASVGARLRLRNVWIGVDAVRTTNFQDDMAPATSVMFGFGLGGNAGIGFATAEFAVLYGVGRALAVGG